MARQGRRGGARWLKPNRRLSAKKAAALAEAGGPTAATCISWFRRLAAAEHAPASAAEPGSSATIAARALEFLILTATRTSAAIRTVPEEFDLDESIGTVRGQCRVAADRWTRLADSSPLASVPATSP